MSSRSEDSHSLMTSRMPKFSELTLRRAYLVWTHLGHKSTFRDVCNYYHLLEAHEATLTPEQRIESQQLDLRLANEPPPSSSFLLENFPDLYLCPASPPQDEKPQDPLKALFQYKNEMSSDIINTSLLIKKFCNQFKKDMQTFLEEFTVFSNKCNLDKNLINVKMYINKKVVEEEMCLAAKLGKGKGTLHDFLD